MRKTSLFASLVCVLISPCALGVGGDMGGTDPNGSPEKPYLIEDLADFDTFADPNNAATYWAAGVHTKLTTDIDLSGRTYTTAVIAPDTDGFTYDFEGTKFGGDFIGNDHTISNLTINGGCNIGLFGYLDSNSTILSLGIEETNINGDDYVGGLAGYSEASVIKNCHVTGQITGDYGVGGLIGYNYFDYFETGIITRCHTTGQVFGNKAVGGLAGYNYEGLILHCYSTSEIVGQGLRPNLIGGLVGDSRGNIISCYASGSVTAYEWVGGLTGDHFGLISYSYATGEVTGTGSFAIGGLSGSNCDKIVACYSTGKVTASSGTGGLVGRDTSSSTYFACFWDTETSQQSTSEGGTGLTTEQMQDVNTFISAGWDFANENENGTNQFWTMPPNGYPQLSAFNNIEPPVLSGSGTNADPYLIHDPNELGAICWYDHRLNYHLVNDIDTTGISWISPPIPILQGTLDGADFNIKNLNITGKNFLGLIGHLGPLGQVKKISIVNACITGNEDVGGLVGRNDGTIISCNTDGLIAGDTSVGGIAGENQFGNLVSCYSKAQINAAGLAGGLAGINRSSITSCYATGPVTGNSSTSCIGGLVGYNSGSQAEIVNCFATGKVSSSRTVGGLVGQNYGTITSSYATGQIITTDETEFFGGFAGFNTTQGICNSCYWDVETCETTVAYTYTAGSYPNYTYPPFYGAVGVVEGKATTEMMMQSTFAGWDFSTPVWMMLREGEDYPRLAWQEIFAGDIAGLYGADMVDFAYLANYWGLTSCDSGTDCGRADIDLSGDVGLGDLVYVGQDWLK
ncbi:MAG: GLUG motif-containing protein [Planctomycetota bacterium]